MKVTVPSCDNGTKAIAGGGEDEEDGEDAFDLRTVKVDVTKDCFWLIGKFAARSAGTGGVQNSGWSTFQPGQTS